MGREISLEGMEIEKISGKNILVTGGTGFVGSHLIEQLFKNNANIITTFLSYNPLSYFFQKKLDKKVKMINVDICDFDKVFEIITKFDVDYVFHLAAQPLVEVAFYNPKRTLYTNIIGTINILEAARLYPKIKGIIVASSDKAYGKLDDGKYKENYPLKGDHPYEVSKSSADLIAYSYYKTYNLPVVITRFGNIYGEGDLNFSRIIPGIMKSLIKNELLEIRSDGKHVRDYLYVKDVVDGYLLLLDNIQKIKGEAFNFGSDETLSVLDLIKLIEKYLNKKISYKILNLAKNEIFYQSLDYSKIKKLGWQPKIKIKDVIEKIYSWYRSFYDRKKT